MPTLEDRICEQHPSIHDWLSKPVRPLEYDIQHDKQRRARQTYARYVARRRLMGAVWSLAKKLAHNGDETLLAPAQVAHTFEERFMALVKRWREETKTISSTTDRALHPAYQDIIGMGERVLPLLFREMQERGGHWFWALRHITHENPVPPQDAGKIQKMTEAWIQWGRDHRYL